MHTNKPSMGSGERDRFRKRFLAIVGRMRESVLLKDLLESGYSIVRKDEHLCRLCSSSFSTYVLSSQKREGKLHIKLEWSALLEAAYLTAERNR
ncbi:Hypothetical protein NTJ_01200 [Nesidiocoris tenuis]|uniref:Uncharacterized protein n=1 Tax=Nesidiocoris tenuis TaxID=355587 RepID=A0ABN7AB98_9HEMI|nr:Hypothetical protein NTJ_01200 [Nesidiocoris tenuis]